MGKYKRLERIIRINALIKVNTELSRSGTDVELRNSFCRNDPGEHEHIHDYFARGNQEFTERKV